MEVTQKTVHVSMHKNLWNSHAESDKMCVSLSLSLIFSYSPVSMRVVNIDPSLSDACHLNLISQTNVNKY